MSTCLNRSPELAAFLRPRGSRARIAHLHRSKKHTGAYKQKLMQIPKLGSDNHEYAVVCTNMPFSSLVAHWKRRSNPLFILARPKLPRPMISSASYPRDEPTDLREQPQASKAPNKLESSRSNQLPPANFKPHTCVWLHLVAGSSLQRSMSQRLREAGL